MASLSDQIWEISQQKKNHQGFTIYTYGLDKPVSGYCVAYSDTQNYFGRDGLDRAIEHAQTHSQIIGGWKTGSNTYFDSVRVFHTKEAAVEAAIIENQLAFYDISGTREITILEEEKDGETIKYLMKDEYANKLEGWNEKRKAKGMQPLKIYN